MRTAARVTVRRLVAAVAGPGVGASRELTIVARGRGWLWLDGAAGPVHVAERGGSAGPLTALVAGRSLRAGDVGEPVRLFVDGARPWHPDPLPGLPDPAALRRALDAVAAAAWPDPAALRLRDEPLAAVASQLIGRGPGLTPAGDDVLLGYLRARHAADPGGVLADARLVAGLARAATGEPGRSLLEWAGRGVAPEPVERALASLLAAPPSGPDVAGLLAWGDSSGRAALAGLLAGLWSAAAPPA